MMKGAWNLKPLYCLCVHMICFSLLFSPFIRGENLAFDFRFIRHALPLEPSFEKKALDSLLKGVAMDTSELFAHFDNGLAKILHMAEAPQLQDVS